MPPVEDNHSFPRKERLKSPLAIRQVVGLRQYINAYPLKCYYLFSEAAAPCPVQVAISVPKRRFKHAVDRNRIKRLFREAYRTRKFRLPESTPNTRYLQLLWVYVGDTVANFETLCKAVEKAHTKLYDTIINNSK